MNLVVATAELVVSDIRRLLNEDPRRFLVIELPPDVILAVRLQLTDTEADMVRLDEAKEKLF